ncbi:putative membrane protein [Burkholderia phage vB_BglM_WTB]
MLRPAIAILLVISVIGIVIAVFLPSSKEVLSDQVATTIISMVVGMVFRDFGTVMSFLFGTSREAQATSQAITTFATTPGEVTLKDKQ